MMTIGTSRRVLNLASDLELNSFIAKNMTSAQVVFWHAENTRADMMAGRAMELSKGLISLQEKGYENKLVGDGICSYLFYDCTTLDQRYESHSDKKDYRH